MAKRLRSGYTTGACAAAAAKAATLLLQQHVPPDRVEIPFPDGTRHSFTLFDRRIAEDHTVASVIKDAGDDPDVTNGAEICAAASYILPDRSKTVVLDNVFLSAGPGVGRATKAGLSVQAGEPAINPIPRQMIKEAVQEVEPAKEISITIFIPEGERLAEKTLNKRLGILGGLSLLGTTGIVRPVSADAWKATIEASMNVTKTAGIDEIVLATGRTSEKGAEKLLDLPEEAYVTMGDYLEFSLLKAKEMGFTTIHLAGMWAKIVKAALHIPQTHVRNGALEVKDAARLLYNLGATDNALFHRLENANTAREMLSHLEDAKRDDIITRVCEEARAYAVSVSQKKVRLYLINAKAEVITHV